MLADSLPAPRAPPNNNLYIISIYHPNTQPKKFTSTSAHGGDAQIPHLGSFLLHAPTHGGLSHKTVVAAYVKFSSQFLLHAPMGVLPIKLLLLPMQSNLSILCFSTSPQSEKECPWGSYPARSKPPMGVLPKSPTLEIIFTPPTHPRGSFPQNYCYHVLVHPFPPSYGLNSRPK